MGVALGGMERAEVGEGPALALFPSLGVALELVSGHSVYRSEIGCSKATEGVGRCISVETVDEPCAHATTGASGVRGPLMASTSSFSISLGHRRQRTYTFSKSDMRTDPRNSAT